VGGRPARAVAALGGHAARERNRGAGGDGKEGMSEGDTSVLPLKTRPGQIALGTVLGPYQYKEIGGEWRHTRRVHWIREVPRSTFRQDLLYSFGAFLTVCRITRNNAEERVAIVLAGGEDPGQQEGVIDDSGVTGDEATDITQAANDEIASFVRSRFQSHDMARLVEGILQAEGFITHRSPPGPDQGVDILAAQGSLGLDAPSLCVQVKATDTAADVSVFRALQGSMNSFGASQGLLVCWGGFTQALRSEARQHTFKIRLWDQTDLISAIYLSYQRLSAEIQAELPLKTVWVLVREDLEG
jgi:restriction system protein